MEHSERGLEPHFWPPPVAIASLALIQIILFFIDKFLEK